MFCEQCGAKNSSSAKFCNSCGRPIENGNTSEPRASKTAVKSKALGGFAEKQAALLKARLETSAQEAGISLDSSDAKISDSGKPTNKKVLIGLGVLLVFVIGALLASQQQNSNTAPGTGTDFGGAPYYDIGYSQMETALDAGLTIEKINLQYGGAESFCTVQASLRSKDLTSDSQGLEQYRQGCMAAIGNR